MFIYLVIVYFVGSLELDSNERGKDSGSQKENRYSMSQYLKSEKKSERKSSHDRMVATSSYGPMTPAGNPMSYTLGHIGVGGSAIAAAASQAIAATQQVCRSVSLKYQLFTTYHIVTQTKCIFSVIDSINYDVFH